MRNVSLPLLRRIVTRYGHELRMLCETMTPSVQHAGLLGLAVYGMVLFTNVKDRTATRKETLRSNSKESNRTVTNAVRKTEYEDEMKERLEVDMDEGATKNPQQVLK